MPRAGPCCALATKVVPCLADCLLTFGFRKRCLGIMMHITLVVTMVSASMPFSGRCPERSSQSKRPANHSAMSPQLPFLRALSSSLLLPLPFLWWSAWRPFPPLPFFHSLPLPRTDRDHHEGRAHRAGFRRARGRRFGCLDQLHGLLFGRYVTACDERQVHVACSRSRQACRSARSAARRASMPARRTPTARRLATCARGARRPFSLKVWFSSPASLRFVAVERWCRQLC